MFVHLLMKANKHMLDHIRTQTHRHTKSCTLIREPEAVRVLDYVACCDLKF